MKDPATSNVRWVMFCLLLAGTALLSLLARGDGVMSVDVRLQRFVQRAPEPIFRWIADFGNWIGSAAVCAVIGFAALLFLSWRRQPVAAALVLIAFAARLQNMALKSFFDSARPTADLVRIDEIAGGLGFPSGHAMGTTLFFGSIAIISHRLIPHRRKRRSVQFLCLTIIVVVGFGRVFVGAHWPSDVLGGFLYGLILLIVIAALIDFITRRYLTFTAG